MEGSFTVDCSIFFFGFFWVSKPDGRAEAFDQLRTYLPSAPDLDTGQVSSACLLAPNNQYTLTMKAVKPITPPKPPPNPIQHKYSAADPRPYRAPKARVSAFRGKVLRQYVCRITYEKSLCKTLPAVDTHRQLDFTHVSNLEDDRFHRLLHSVSPRP